MHFTQQKFLHNNFFSFLNTIAVILFRSENKLGSAFDSYNRAQPQKLQRGSRCRGTGSPGGPIHHRQEHGGPQPCKFTSQVAAACGNSNPHRSIAEGGC